MRALMDGVGERGRIIDRLDLASVRGTAHDEKYLHLIVHRLRRKLAVYGIDIDTMWGIGYWMTPANRALMLELVVEPAAVTAPET